MRVSRTEMPGVLLLEPRVFRDDRGSFRETWSRARYEEAGIGLEFVQDNVSLSRRGTLRGLHYQEPNAQGKLVSVLRGEVWDVAVDIRRGSPTFGRWAGFTLSEENGHQLWVPPGYAHGFVALADDTVFSYRCTDYYTPAAEGTVLWSDPELAIAWPLDGQPLLAPKDADGLPLRETPAERLPVYTGEP